MNQGTKKKTQDTLISSQWEAPWSHYSPWLPRELPAPTPRPHFCPPGWFSWYGEKNCFLASLDFSPSTTLALCSLAQSLFFPQGGPELLINLRPKMPNSIFRQVGHSRWVCWGCDIRASRCLNLDFHGELLERAAKVVIKHKVWRQLRITIMGQKASPPPH